MSKGKFKNVQLDENGNVAKVVLPVTNIEPEIHYEVDESGESIPTAVTLEGKDLNIEQFNQVEVNKEGNISVGGGSTGGSGKPWWWDWFYNRNPGGSTGIIIDNGNINKVTTMEVKDDNQGIGYIKEER